MASHTHGQDLLTALAKELKLDSLAFDEDNMCMLQGEDGMTLTLLLHEDQSSLTFAAGIYLLSNSNNRNALYEKLLKMNFLLLETQGATFSIDEEAQEVVLCRQLQIESLDAAHFLDFVFDFLVLTSWLREQLMQWPTAPTSSPEDAFQHRIHG